MIAQWGGKTETPDVESTTTPPPDFVESNHSLPTDRAGVSQAQFTKLRNLNIAAAVVQTVSAAGIFALTDRDVFYTLYTNFADGSRPDGNGSPWSPPEAEESISVSIGYSCGVFLLLSALDHLLVCTCAKDAYEKGISNNYNIFRWVEYAISASVMRVVVALLSGILDIQMLFLIFGLTATTMLFGLVFELENSENRMNGVRWYSFGLGFIPHFFAWLIIICYFFVSVTRGDPGPPGFVYSIIFIIFFLDLTFAIILLLQWLARGRFRSYVSGEIAFIVLSFTSKNLLAWINFFGGSR